MPWGPITEGALQVSLPLGEPLPHYPPPRRAPPPPAGPSLPGLPRLKTERQPGLEGRGLLQEVRAGGWEAPAAPSVSL